jgi:hypothetical protein
MKSAEIKMAIAGSVFICLTLAGGAETSTSGEKRLPLDGPEAEKPFGFIEDGKIYRSVNGPAISGKDINDLRFEENRTDFAAEFARQKLVEAELEDAGIEVSAAETDAELRRMLREFAVKKGVDPAQVAPEKLAAVIGRPIYALTEAAKINIGVMRLLIKKGRLKAQTTPESPEGRAAVADFTARVLEKKDVILDPESLNVGEGVRVDGRPWSLELLRRWTLERLGAPVNREFADILEVLTLELLVREALAQKGQTADVLLKGVASPDRRPEVVAAVKKLLNVSEDTAAELAYQTDAVLLTDADPGKVEQVKTLLAEAGAILEIRAKSLSDEDRSFFWSFQCRMLEVEKNIPDGRSALSAQIKSRGLSVESFLKTRKMTADIMLTRLARLTLSEKDIRAEFTAHPERYRRAENLIAHLFVRVLDPEGRPYQPLWRAPGHERVNDFAAKVREERFLEAKPKIEQYLGTARNDFAAAVRKFSDDAVSRETDGLLGRVGKHTILPPPCDEIVKVEALKLKPGEMSAPVRGSYGWHLIKCLEKQDVTYEEAREHVYLFLLRTHRDKILRDLRASAKIQDFF